MAARRRLVVNADDFGFTHDVNSGIVEAHQRGILTATTVMANGAAFEDAVRLARETPTLDVGCHLVLVGGRSLVTGEALPATVGRLMGTLGRRGLDPVAELRAQIERCLAAGLAPLHLDTHKHTHLLPPVLEAVARLAGEYGIRWVRRPFDFPLTPEGVPWAQRVVSRAMTVVRGRFHRVLARHGCSTTDHFAGFQITGAYSARDLVGLIEALPEGTTELMVHPGHCGAELMAAKTRLKESRARELAALVDPAVREALGRCGVELARYGGL